jgi:hypothetical protein
VAAAQEVVEPGVLQQEVAHWLAHLVETEGLLQALARQLAVETIGELLQLVAYWLAGVVVEMPRVLAEQMLGLECLPQYCLQAQWLQVHWLQVVLRVVPHLALAGLQVLQQPSLPPQVSERQQTVLL